MATNKNQHFVPRCYLRPFTVDGQNLAINLLNLDRERFIENAPVKNQCSRDYFYGKDQKLEDAIQAIEGRYASVLREILTPNYKLTDDHKQLLCMFWLLQHLRTEAASKRSVEMSEGLADGLSEAAEAFKLEIATAVQIAMGVFAKNMYVVDDLKVCLVRNRSTTPFITSDDPAVLTNRWHFMNAHRASRSFGLHQSGTLILLPLSPDVYFIGYDSNVYSIPNDNGWASIKNSADVDALNQHQYLNCRANIFLRNPDSLPAIIKGYNSIKSRRKTPRHQIIYLKFEKSVGAHDRYIVVDKVDAQNEEEVLMHYKVVHLEPLYWPNLLQWRNKGAVYTNGTGAGYLRPQFIPGASQQPFWKEPLFKR